MFEFRGIICRHIITVLIRDGIRSLLDKYILRRWRRDVSRSYTRVKINYDDWISTPSQLRYDKLCSVFAKLVDVVADEEDSTQITMEWMESQLTALRKSNMKPSCGSNIHVENSVQEQFPNSREATIASRVQILDPRCSQTNGAPRKLCKKGSLETSSKKAKNVPLGRNSKKANVGSSKVNEGNAPMQNIVQDSQAFSEGFTQGQL
ncbi:protein FAR1-RELATED SEQUENCE 1-like [Diospyros lotus]|uniref:protein FAR1-RELATED SEQUENCE 1-like n=1 Tax=Diospyros lotus TaxID=55363 RepID=UPI00225617AD|nr:protein FAR1-RELATED SEQUENCE 1-like [Diospyros lotus]